MACHSATVPKRDTFFFGKLEDRPAAQEHHSMYRYINMYVRIFNTEYLTQLYFANESDRLLFDLNQLLNSLDLLQYRSTTTARSEVKCRPQEQGRSLWGWCRLEVIRPR